MKIEVKFVKETKEETLSKIYIDNEFYGYVLEDQKQDKKVMHETRIPEGTYNVVLQPEGKFHEKYKIKFPKFHKGMLHITNVPNFSGILIHIGNFDTDTSGCLLLGKSFSERSGRITIQQSTDVYSKFYPVVARAISAGEKVTINISRNPIVS